MEVYDKPMKYVKAAFLIIIVLLFTGCIEQISSRFQKVDVVYVNLIVITEENKTLITNMTATRGEVAKINAPGFVAPDKFPGIYVKIKQSINASKPELVKDVSVPNGMPYIGPGNYSFTVQLFKGDYNKTQPIFVYSEIIDNKSMRLARNMTGINSTEK